MKSLEIVNLCLEELLNNKTEICEYDLLQIKQDLEVLEILRKYFPKNCHPLICDRKELEKWNKAKQWLKENEL